MTICPPSDSTMRQGGFSAHLACCVGVRQLWIVRGSGELRPVRGLLSQHRFDEVDHPQLDNAEAPKSTALSLHGPGILDDVAADSTSRPQKDILGYPSPRKAPTKRTTPVAFTAWDRGPSDAFRPVSPAWVRVPIHVVVPGFPAARHATGRRCRAGTGSGSAR